MIGTFDGLDVLYHHAKFGEERAPAVGAKMWCLFFYRQFAASRHPVGIKFTHRPKISIFAPQGDSFHRFM